MKTIKEQVDKLEKIKQSTKDENIKESIQEKINAIKKAKTVTK